MSIMCNAASPIGSVLGGGWPQPALGPEGRPPSPIVVTTLPPSLPPLEAPLLAPEVPPPPLSAAPLSAPVPLPLPAPVVSPVPLVATVDPVAAVIDPDDVPELGDPVVALPLPVLVPVDPVGLPVPAFAPVEPPFTFSVGVPPLQPTAIAPRTPNRTNVREDMEATVASTVLHSIAHVNFAPANCNDSRARLLHESNFAARQGGGCPLLGAPARFRSQRLVAKPLPSPLFARDASSARDLLTKAILVGTETVPSREVYCTNPMRL